MKQKIVINVQIPCKKCRTKAMKIAAKADGVIKVEIQREKNQLVVIGDGVDAVKLTCSLRKKLGFATVVSVEEEKEKKPEIIPIQYSPWPCPYAVVSDPNPSVCSFM